MLERGDIIIMGFGILPIEHIAIYDGKGIYENRIGKNVVYVTYDDFIARYQFWDIKETYKITASEEELEKIFSKAKKLLGKKYDVLNYNCEHFIDDIFGKPQRSESLEKVVSLGAGLIVGSIITSIAIRKMK